MKIGEVWTHKYIKDEGHVRITSIFTDKTGEDCVGYQYESSSNSYTIAREYFVRSYKKVYEEAITHG